ncbi:MAG: hypothetical protein HY445_00805, partial [Candidatus Niyogibacteria bacterium]|nr:hypothetical protein [Candidatus Niyogibacteria bacterium]
MPISKKEMAEFQEDKQLCIEKEKSAIFSVLGPKFMSKEDIKNSSLYKMISNTKYFFDQALKELMEEKRVG